MGVAELDFELAALVVLLAAVLEACEELEVVDVTLAALPVELPLPLGMPLVVSPSPEVPEPVRLTLMDEELGVEVTVADVDAGPVATVEE